MPQQIDRWCYRLARHVIRTRSVQNRRYEFRAGPGEPAVPSVGMPRGVARPIDKPTPKDVQDLADYIQRAVESYYADKPPVDPEPMRS